MDGSSHLFALLAGYAVLDGAAMPIVGPVETANDTFMPQLVANARAAVDYVVARGVADRDKIAVGGHSYGAFMAANLLAHSDLFRTAIARSGAYNRTLTPFGFQNEERTLWQAPEVYRTVSPFMAADKVDEPILLIHGADDNNSGTFPIQSERFFAALQGHGAIARLVMLPHESHGYRARESVLHVLAETIAWLDQWVKDAPPRGQGG
jgi:dipeptidyl aminopeptidase/acylaminoacyl peptidase